VVSHRVDTEEHSVIKSLTHTKVVFGASCFVGMANGENRYQGSEAISSTLLDVSTHNTCEPAAEKSGF